RKILPRGSRQAKRKHQRRRPPRLILPHNDFGADVYPVVEIDHVVVDKPEAARRHCLPDRLRSIGAMNPIYRGAKKHRTRAERVAGPAGHKAWQIGLPLEHFWRRMPVRPLDLAAYLKKPLPSETVAADTDAIAHRVRWILDQVEVPFERIDDDGARWLLRTVEHHLALKFLRPVG